MSDVMGRGSDSVYKLRRAVISFQFREKMYVKFARSFSFSHTFSLFNASVHKSLECVTKYKRNKIHSPSRNKNQFCLKC